MLRQSISPAILALLVAHCLINSVIGVPTTASATAGFALNATSITELPWPSYLPGWGMLTVSRDLLAEEYNMGLLNQSGAWETLPSVYTTHRQGNSTCGNPHDFPHTHAINGTFCLPEGDDYESVVRNITSQALVELATDTAHCGCRCKCRLGCLASLILWPICAIGCLGCRD